MTNGSRMRAISQLQDIVLWDLILVLEGLRVQKVQVHLKYETRYILGQLGVFFNSGLRIENLSESRLDCGISWESLGISWESQGISFRLRNLVGISRNEIPAGPLKT